MKIKSIDSNTVPPMPAHCFYDDDEKKLSTKVPEEEPEVPHADVPEVDDELVFVDPEDETQLELDEELVYIPL